MSTELKGTSCRTGEVNMTEFWGGTLDNKSVQLTFKKPEERVGQSDFGYWYLQLNKKQALELAAALVEFANDAREEAE